ncbi:MAG: GGDEF domain-containing protein [Peptococcaceae bacterium]|nr:GGDEF domain-containing protein [Peptococcaceae bacterium]
MTLLTMGEQVILQTIICFSFLIFILSVMLNKDRTFSRMFGISFFLPLVLGLICIFGKDQAMGRSILLDVNFVFLIMGGLLLLLWARKKYDISLVLLLLSPLVAVLLLKKVPPAPFLPLSPYLEGGVTIGLTGMNIYLLRKIIPEKDPELTWAVCLLGISQTLYFLYPTRLSYLVALGNFSAYFLFSSYVFKKSRNPYIVRIKKAEAKLSDMNKTINMEVKKRLLEMERHNAHLINMVHRDPLVDAYNKKGITNFMQEMVIDPGKDPFTIILFDIDNFKGINDTRGHVAGDMVLKKVANIAKQNIRGFDLLGRYGGDEFLIILPGTTVADALYVAERFRKKVSSESEISVSVGVAAFPEDGTTVQKLIETADAGLYESKRLGKNAVSHFTGHNIKR